MPENFREKIVRLAEGDVKIYVKDVSEVPQGYEPLSGPRGGIYYIADKKDAEEIDKDKKDVTDKPKKDEEQKTIPKPTTEEIKNQEEKRAKQKTRYGYLSEAEVAKLPEEEINKIIDSVYDWRAIESLAVAGRKFSKEQIDTLFDEGTVHLGMLSEYQTLSNEQIYDVLTSQEKRSFVDHIFKYQKLNDEQINYVLDNWSRFSSEASDFFNNQTISGTELQKKALSKYGSFYSMINTQVFSKDIIDININNGNALDELLQLQPLSEEQIEKIIQKQMSRGSDSREELEREATTLLIRNKRLSKEIFDKYFDKANALGFPSFSLRQMCMNRKLDDTQIITAYNYASSIESKDAISTLIANQILKPDIQMRIFETNDKTHILNMISHQKLDDKIIDKIIETEDLAIEFFGEMLVYQKFTQEQIKAFLIKWPQGDKTPLFELQDITEDTARHLLETREFEVKELNEMYKRNKFSQEFLLEQLQKPGIKIAPIVNFATLDRKNRDLVYEKATTIATGISKEMLLDGLYTHQTLDPDEIDRTILHDTNYGSLIYYQKLNYQQIDAVLEQNESYYERVINYQTMSDAQIRRAISIDPDFSGDIFQNQILGPDNIDQAISDGRELEKLYRKQTLDHNQALRAISRGDNLDDIYSYQTLDKDAILAAISRGESISYLYRNGRIEFDSEIIDAAIARGIRIDALLDKKSVVSKLNKEQIKALLELGIKSGEEQSEIISSPNFDSEMIDYCLEKDHMTFSIAKYANLNESQVDALLERNGSYIGTLIPRHLISKNIINNVLSMKYNLDNYDTAKFFSAYITDIDRQAITDFITNPAVVDESYLSAVYNAGYQFLTPEEVSIGIKKGVALKSLIANYSSYLSEDDINNLFKLSPQSLEDVDFSNIYNNAKLNEKQVDAAILNGLGLFDLYRDGNATSLTDNNITTAITKGKELDRLYMNYYKQLTEKHINMIISGDKRLQSFLGYANRIRLSDEQINAIIDKPSDVVNELLDNRGYMLTDAQVQRIIDKNDDSVLKALVEKAKLTEEHTSALINKKNLLDRENHKFLKQLMYVHSLSNQSIATIIESRNEELIEAVASSQKLSSENIRTIIDLKNPEISKSLFSGHRGEQFTSSDYFYAIEAGESLGSLYMSHARYFSDKHYAAALEKNERLDVLFWSQPENISDATKKLFIDKIFSDEFIDNPDPNYTQEVILNFLASVPLTPEETERVFAFILSHENDIINGVVKVEPAIEPEKKYDIVDTYDDEEDYEDYETDDYDEYDDESESQDDEDEDYDSSDDYEMTRLDRIYERLEKFAKKYRLPILEEVRAKVIPKDLLGFGLTKYTSNRKELYASKKLYDKGIELRDELDLPAPLAPLVGTYVSLDNSFIESIVKTKTEFTNRDGDYVITKDDYNSVLNILNENDYELNFSNTRFAKRKGLEKARDISVGSIFQKMISNSEKKIKELDKKTDDRQILDLTNNIERIKAAMKSFAKIQQYQIKDSSELEIVFSNTPLDMLRKSTTQAWTTCESFDGAYHKGIISDIAANHIIAYVRKKGTSNWLSRCVVRWGKDDESGKINAIVERSWGSAPFYDIFANKAISDIVRSHGYSAMPRGKNTLELPIEHMGYADTATESVGASKYMVADRPDEEETNRLKLLYKKLSDTFEESFFSETNDYNFVESYYNTQQSKIFEFYTKMFRKVAELYMPKTPEPKKESNYKERLKALSSTLSEKYRIYVGTIGEAPQGVQLFTGPHGGKYYYSDEPDGDERKKDVSVDQKTGHWGSEKPRDVDKANKDTPGKKKKFKPSDFEYYKLLKMSFQELQEAIKERKYLNYIYRTQRLYPENIDLAIDTGLYLDILYSRHELSAGQIEKAILVGEDLKTLFNYQNLSEQQKKEVIKKLKTKKESFRKTLQKIKKEKMTLDEVAFKTFRQKFLELSDDERRRCLYVYANWTDEYN